MRPIIEEQKHTAPEATTTNNRVTSPTLRHLAIVITNFHLTNIDNWGHVANN